MENHGIDGSNNPDIKVERSLRYPQAPLQCHADAQPNVLVIAVDSFRADLVDSQTMPFLQHYSQQNQLFTHHLSGGNQYSSGMFSLLYGLQGSYMDAVDLNYTAPLLTQTLKQQGYQLGLFTTDDGVNEAKPKAIFKDFAPVLASEKGGSALSDIASVDAFQQWRHQQHGPWFALLNLKSPEDYDTPVGFLGVQTVKPAKPLKPAEKVLFNQYRQSLNFIDQQLQRLLEALPQDTIVLITGVSGKLFTSNTDEARHNLSPDNIQVPLIIHWPGSVSGKVNYRTSHYGVVPTLMTQVLGCTNPASDYSAGRHLMQPDDQTWLYIGDNRVFAIYQQNEITVIDRHGKYRIYDEDYSHRLHKKMSAPEMIEVMREGRRLYSH
jgi:hypothetical protein